MLYTTLSTAKSQMNLKNTTASDQQIMTYIRWSTGFIREYKGRRYDIRKEVIYQDVPHFHAAELGQFDSRLSRLPAQRKKQLLLNDNLLECLELMNGDGSLLTDYTLDPIKPPFSVISLHNGLDWVSDGTKTRSIKVTGLWGNHDDYSNAFQPSLDTLLVAVNDSVTVLQVTDVNGVAGDLMEPRFQAGQLIRLEDEFCYIVTATAKDAANDELTVIRGYNGTTKAAHGLGCEISIFRVQSIIEQACIRLVKWRHSQKDSDLFDKVYIPGGGPGSVTVPTALPTDVRELLGPRGRSR